MKYYEIQNLYQENISLNDLLLSLHSNDDILEYYLILHDKDFFDTGELKKPHYHLYIGFDDFGRYTIQKVREYFLPISNRIFSVKSIKCAIRYLIHLDDKNKYQYCIDNIYTNDIDKVKKALDNSKLKLNDVLEIFIDKCYNFEICVPTDIIKFFRSYGLLNYCLLHYKNLCNTLETIQCSYECEVHYKKERSSKEC